MKRLCLLVLVALAAACVAPDPLPRNPVAAKAEIAALIPEGTSLSDAQARLERKGFKCRVRNDLNAAHTVYLYGSADRLAMPMVKRGWFVRFEVRDDQVYTPFVDVELTGP